MKLSSPTCGLFVVLVGLSFGCKRDEPRLATPPPVLGPSGAAGQGLPPGHPALTGDEPLPTGHPPLQAQRAATGPLAWDLPKGWTESRGEGMRLATLKPATAGVDVSVVVLPGPAGGELGNVNRWRGQIGLPPIDEAARLQARTAVHAKVGELSLYDFTAPAGKQQRMVAGLLVLGGQTWFFKMTGDQTAVGAAKAELVKLLESLHTT